MLRTLLEDVAYANEANGTRHSTFRQWLASPALRCVTFMRIAARGGVLGKLARSHLLAAFGCDVGKGAAIGPGVILPHPTGIVIGIGVQIKSRVTIYQGVTLGANARGEYPIIEPDVKLYPNSMVTGRVRIGRGATIGAGAYIYSNVLPGAVVRGPRAGAE